MPNVKKYGFLEAESRSKPYFAEDIRIGVDFWMAARQIQISEKICPNGKIGSKTLTQINKDLKEINGNMGDYKRTKTGTGRLSQSLFTGSYTVSEIEKKLSDIYKKAPEVVQTRKALIKKGVDAVRALKDEAYANNNWRK